NSGLLKVTLSEGYEDEDLSCPGCNNNAFVSPDGKFFYVDFQSFNLINYERYLQDIAAQAEGPGRQGDRPTRSAAGASIRVQGLDVDRRTAAIAGLLGRENISIRDRLVIEVGSKAGGMLAHCLKLGAAWCHGLEREEQAACSERLLLALGCTRFSISTLQSGMPASTDGGVPAFLKPMLNGSILVISGDYASRPLPEPLYSTPWSFLVLEYEHGGPKALLGNQNGHPKYPEGLRRAAFSSYEDERGRTLQLAVFSREPRV